MKENIKGVALGFCVGWTVISLGCIVLSLVVHLVSA